MDRDTFYVNIGTDESQSKVKYSYMSIKESFAKLDAIINGTCVLCVPIVSSINRETNQYKLDCDGNINRIVTAFSHANSFDKLTILLPSNYESMNILNVFKENNEGKVILKHTGYFGKHAGEQRSLPECYENTLKLIEKKYSEYDWIFVESQYLANALCKAGYKNKLIFYNNVCGIKLDGVVKTRSFMKGYDKLNKKLVDNCAYTICVSPETTEYWKSFSISEGNTGENILNLPYLIDRELPYFDYNPDSELQSYIQQLAKDGCIIYLPYRLTDEGYQMNKVVYYVNRYCNLNNVCILYSDPNNSGFMETLKTKFSDKVKYVKVSTDRNIYYTLIDSSLVTIPYFEDIAFINHATIHEMFSEKANCNIVLDKTQTIEKISDYKPIPIYRISFE